MHSISARAFLRFPGKCKFKRILPSPTWGCRSVKNLVTVVDSAQKDPAELDQITTLSNGLRVATEALPGPFSGIGVFVDAGSRYENEELRGVSHIVDRLAFKSTKSRTADEMREDIESHGGNLQCVSSRESLFYQAASFNASVPTTVGLLAETIRDPMITEFEVQEQLETADYEIGEIWSKPELILPELVSMTAYKNNTLGNPILCPQERLKFINKNVVEKYRHIFYRPERIVVAFAGVNHEEALRLTEKYFGDMRKEQVPVISGTDLSTSFTDPPSTSRYGFPSTSSASSSIAPTSGSSATTSTTPPSQTSRLLSSIPFLKNLSTSASSLASVASVSPSYSTITPLDLTAPSHYTGGFLSLPPLEPPQNPALPHLSYIHLAFEAPPISSPDVYALATLQTLLGGGGSFSAGGPGKGMYSRLYTNVLNQHSWVESCVAFNHSYIDSGLFGISASCTPARVKQMLDVMCRELKNLTLDTGYSALQAVEIQRAKNQLKSALLMNLESRMIELEDLGRQVQAYGRRIGVKEMCTRIDTLTRNDLIRVAQQVLGGGVANAGKGSGAPTVVLQEGQQSVLRRQEFKWDDIQERIGGWKLGRRLAGNLNSI